MFLIWLFLKCNVLTFYTAPCYQRGASLLDTHPLVVAKWEQQLDEQYC